MDAVRYKLDERVTLIPGGEVGFIVAPSPLRVIKVREAAIALLRLCDGTRTLEQILAKGVKIERKAALSFLQTLADKEIVRRVYPSEEDVRPRVSVVVPVRNRPDDIRECLKSLLAMNYPAEKLEIIVVDDGSTDATPQAAASFPVKVISTERHEGPSAGRNLGARAASGDIVAFTDSDCLVDRDWLMNLTPPFADAKVAAVGGMVESLRPRSSLEKYEQVRSPLFMGYRDSWVRPNAPVSYLPGCNLLVRKKVLMELNGFDESFSVGEDVDLIWRIHQLGYQVRYLARGKMYHRHRNQMRAFLRRRADYGYSEALLLAKHPINRRVFFCPLPMLISLGLLVAGVLLSNPVVLSLAFAPPVVQFIVKGYRLRRLGLNLGIGRVFRSVLNGYAAFVYHLLKNLSRYYAIPLLLAGIFSARVLMFALAVLLLPAWFDFVRLRPELSLPRFAALYVLENLAYQMGVLIGCLKRRTVVPVIPALQLQL